MTSKYMASLAATILSQFNIVHSTPTSFLIHHYHYYSPLVKRYYSKLPSSSFATNKKSSAVRIRGPSSINNRHLHMQSQTPRDVIHFESLSSTQDEARKLLKEYDNSEKGSVENDKIYMAVTTTCQTKGRGTSGRTWIGEIGNTFVTISIPMSNIKIPITLIPVQMGIIVAERVHNIIQNHNRNQSIQYNEGKEELITKQEKADVRVKWPNDVLINGKKNAGVLIESDTDKNGKHYLLVGIGINYKYAPTVEQDGPERGRETTCICDSIICDDDNDCIDAAKLLGKDIANDVWDWVELQSNWDGAAEAVVRKFEYWTDFGKGLVLRDNLENEIVIPINIESDGRLKVRGRDGKERLLCTDYLL